MVVGYRRVGPCKIFPEHRNGGMDINREFRLGLPSYNGTRVETVERTLVT